MITRNNGLEVACRLAGPGHDSEAVESLSKRQQQVLELAWKHLGRRAFKRPQEWEQEQEDLENDKPESSPNHSNSHNKKQVPTVQDGENNRQAGTTAEGRHNEEKAKCFGCQGLEDADLRIQLSIFRPLIK